MPNINNYVISLIEQGKYQPYRKGKCQNMNHDENDNPIQYVTLILEWNKKHKVFIDKNPEYWCHDCMIEDCD